jgi:hypothetical protein
MIAPWSSSASAGFALGQSARVRVGDSVRGHAADDVVGSALAEWRDVSLGSVEGPETLA